ncbi:GPI-anchored surface protein, putative [Bodo saltans]|uniref:GPI-anchored surface protein, putative n=1 Tax=Bodo saltans TaxID=75058 RepID=A0A0S4J461_BODSA|nr:GPI-anchored surface protein, putative [Bodo saltans]|eukprot:CUG74299.1 GPI-anchored surface protein, putative [Bodo saltans]
MMWLCSAMLGSEVTAQDNYLILFLSCYCHVLLYVIQQVSMGSRKTQRYKEVSLPNASGLQIIVTLVFASGN